MIKTLSCFVSSLLLCGTCIANYTTPGTGVRWNLNDLVTNSGGTVSLASGDYYINDVLFISSTDTLYIDSNEKVLFAENAYLDVKGVLLVNPPDSVHFTRQDGAPRFLGIRIDSSDHTVLKKLVIEYANALRIFDSSPLIDSCTFRYSSLLTDFGNAAIVLFRSKAVITNSRFIDNNRAAIQGGANIANAPIISNCVFMGNNTLNLNVPQINLGASGSDTTRITGNQILRASTNSGGIGFLPVGTVHAIIHDNIIKNNRYGITLNGGSNINAMITYNQIDSNNTQNNPMLGGSGIAFSGGSASSHQNTIVTGNAIRWNLWGITIQGGSRPNIGDLTNTDTSDDGKNYFLDNTNGTTPFIDLYNNSAYDIMAQGNYWGTNDPVEIENRIFHQPDQSTLGLVNYSNYIIPVELASFIATANGEDVNIKWHTLSESNSRNFELQRSNDGIHFETIFQVAAAGTTVQPHYYDYTDRGILTAGGIVYYRLKQNDGDGKYKYSGIVQVRPGKTTGRTRIYPTVFKSYQPLQMEYWSEKNQVITLEFFSAEGKRLGVVQKTVERGANHLLIHPPALPTGYIYIRYNDNYKQGVFKMLHQ